jgi:hypothetical protein
MEYHPGGNLADHARAPVPWWEACGIAAGLADAVETAHRAGICHRDIKPDNVLLSGYGRWVLADFGIALSADDPRTRTGELVASLAHTAPEVFGGAVPSPQQDIYALGTTLVTMLTGRDEFGPRSDESLPSTLRRIATEPVAPLDARGLPSAVAAIIAAATAKDPAARPSSCLAFGQALNDALVGAGFDPTPLLVDDDRRSGALEQDGGVGRHDLRMGWESSAVRTERRRRRLRVLTGGLGMSGLAIGAAVMFGASRGDGQGPNEPIVVDLALAVPQVVVSNPVASTDGADPLLSDEEVGSLVAAGLDDLLGGSDDETADPPSPDRSTTREGRERLTSPPSAGTDSNASTDRSAEPAPTPPASSADEAQGRAAPDPDVAEVPSKRDGPADADGGLRGSDPTTGRGARPERPRR